MRYLTIVSKVTFFIFFICVFAKSWHLITEGFRTDKVNNNLSEECFDSRDNFYEIDKIFDQKFKYLAKGCQTYVFESEDKNYVIKFIRYHRYHIPFWINVLDYFDSYKNLRQSYKSKLLNDSLNSYRVAHKYLKDETAVLYVHLNKTNHLNKKIQIIDNLNRKYLIDLDNTGFLMQRKVESFDKVLKKNKNNEKKLKELTYSFLQTTKSLYLKGFNNDDYNCVKNAGVIGDKVVHSDVGSFLQKNLSEKEAFEKEFMHFIIYFKKWAEKNAPFLIVYVDEEIKKMSNAL